MSGQWLKGRLLLSLPTVREDAFYRTVILVLAHGPQGALGVVLEVAHEHHERRNRGIELEALRVLGHLRKSLRKRAVLFL